MVWNFHHTRNFPKSENSRGSVLRNSHGFHSLQSDIQDQIGLPMLGRISVLWSSTNWPIDQYTWDEIWDHKGYPNQSDILWWNRMSQNQDFNVIQWPGVTQWVSVIPLYQKRGDTGWKFSTGHSKSTPNTEKNGGNLKETRYFWQYVTQQVSDWT
jgi:hypothetical protein